MTAFWVYAALLIALSLSFILVPLMRKGIDRSPVKDLQDRSEQNIKIFKERLAELERDKANGNLDSDTFELLKSELELSLLDDVEPLTDSSDSSVQKEELTKGPRPYLFFSALVTVVTVVVSVGLYFKLGAYEEQKQLNSMRFAPAEIEQARAAAESGDMSSLIEQLYTKLKTAPDNVEGWMLLSRTAMNMENYALAAEGFDTVIKSLEGRGEDSSSVYGLLAQARYFEAGGMSIPAQAAVSQALKMNPNEVNSIGLKAIHAFDQKRYTQAAELWEGLLTIAPEHPARVSIETGIARARALSGMASVLQSASKAAPAADIREPSSDLEPTAPSIEVSVSLSDEFTQNFAPTDVVFIFARAVNGPPMPLAASKHRISELPLTVVLNDSTAMSPQFTLSSVDEVNVVARVSKSGQPIAQAGDVQSVPVRVSTRELSSVALVMDQAVR